MAAGSRAARLILVGANPLAAETSCAAVLAMALKTTTGSRT
jgi:hypothetical protein